MNPLTHPKSDKPAHRDSPAFIVAELMAENPQFRQQVEEGIRQINDSMQDFVDRHFGGPVGLQSWLDKLAENLRPFIAALPQIESLATAAERKAFEELPSYGWYLDRNVGTKDFLKLIEAIHEGNQVEIEEILVRHFRTHLDEIERSLSKANPKRARFLAAAFSSHRSGQYLLAIPVFLAQIDGISREILGTEFFRPNGAGAAQALLGSLADDLVLENLLRSLAARSALTKHSSKALPGELNRHGVLHGCDLTYDTEVNSLKAISLLRLMSQLLELKKAAPESGTALVS